MRITKTEGTVTIHFTRVGTLALELWETKDGAGQNFPEVWRCERCKCLVMADDSGDHVVFHAQFGLERWPELTDPPKGHGSDTTVPSDQVRQPQSGRWAQQNYHDMQEGRRWFPFAKAKRGGGSFKGVKKER